jgi:hypothetical protein
MSKNANICSCGRPIVAFRSKRRHGVVRPKKDHDLCQRCWKAEQDRSRVVKDYNIGEDSDAKEF